MGKYKVIKGGKEKNDLDIVPTILLCEGIMEIIKALERRGKVVRDFDNKAKYVQGVQIIKGDVYFLSAEGKIEKS